MTSIFFSYFKLHNIFSSLLFPTTQKIFFQMASLKFYVSRLNYRVTRSFITTVQRHRRVLSWWNDFLTPYYEATLPNLTKQCWTKLLRVLCINKNKGNWMVRFSGRQCYRDSGKQTVKESKHQICVNPTWKESYNE